MAHRLRIALAASALSVAAAFLQSQNPPWPASYDMASSRITMACNSSGWFNASIAAELSGIVSFDWSNAKAQWAKARPMDCEERLALQAAAVQAVSPPTTRPFVYRNLVKALPWFSSVREKLTDPAYASWFLRFKPNGTYHVPQCDDNFNPPLCTPFYHDQEQTPEVPTPSNPNPDGSCVGVCDCGGVPCGEYLWDHRATEPVNGETLQQFLVRHVVNNVTGVGGPGIFGVFIDDFWCSNIVNGTGACTDPVQGPTEVDPHSQEDMGLSDEDIADITRGWLSTMTAVQAAVLEAGGYTWSLMPGQENANASPHMVTKDNCAALVRPACGPSVTAPWQNAPLLFGITPPSQTGAPFPQADQDIAAFLLMRGPYAYIGYGIWGLTWPTGVAYNGEEPESDDPDAPKIERFREIHRLYFTVKAIDNDCAIVPRGSYVIDADKKVIGNSYYQGISYDTSLALRGYMHFRYPQSEQAKVLLKKPGLIKSGDFMDCIDKDAPAGIWALAHNSSGTIASVRSLFRNLLPVQPKPPQGFKDYLMNRCTYVIAGNAASRLSVPVVSPPPSLPPPMRDLFAEQEKERYRLRMQHLIEKEKLVLSVEQEILRVHGRAARALANQALPFSVCTLLKDQEVYSALTPEQEEKDRNARSRYNGRLFLSWLQDVDDKWEKIKESMLLRHHNEAESLHAVQRMDWEWKVKELGLCEPQNKPVIDEVHVPMVNVSDDFDLLPA